MIRRTSHQFLACQERGIMIDRHSTVKITTLVTKSRAEARPTAHVTRHPMFDDDQERKQMNRKG